MGDPLDFYIDEGGWPYPDDGDDDRVTGPEDLRSGSDDDLVALHAIAPHLFDGLTPTQRAVVVARAKTAAPAAGSARTRSAGRQLTTSRRPSR